MKGHFSELLLFITLIAMLVFSVHMSAVHNDSLASKGMEFGGQALAALLTLMVASKQGMTNRSTDVPPPPKEPPNAA